MTGRATLDASQRHMLWLIVKGRDESGWASVSKQLFPLLPNLPAELAEREGPDQDGRGRVRLTDEGQRVFDAMGWLR